MNSTLTLSANAATLEKMTLLENTAAIGIFPAATAGRRKPLTVAQLRRTLARKWDMLAVIGLMLASAAYGIFALAHVA